MGNSLQYRCIEPDPDLEDFVCLFSSIHHLSKVQEGIIIPNGRIDLVWCKTSENNYQVLLMGLETQPKTMPQRNIESFFAISFNPLGLEYVLRESIADFVNTGKELPVGFWDFTPEGLNDFNTFCQKATAKIRSLVPAATDPRKRQLFRLIFQSNGTMSIRELSEKVHWSERQINRYFNQQLGISLKAYCNILRFQASLSYIKKGQLAPQSDKFTDQSHFIKEIKKLSGVSPKELFKNENDRFLQFLVYPPK